MKNALRGSVATLPKHATSREDRKLLEKKARDKALAEYLKTRKAVDRLLSKSRRDVKTVDGYKEKAMASSGTGADIVLSVDTIEKAVKDAGIFSVADALKFSKFVKYNYSQYRA